MDTSSWTSCCRGFSALFMHAEGPSDRSDLRRAGVDDEGRDLSLATWKRVWPSSSAMFRLRSEYETRRRVPPLSSIREPSASVRARSSPAPVTYRPRSKKRRATMPLARTEVATAHCGIYFFWS
jgi:hypothetical protein